MQANRKKCLFLNLTVTHCECQGLTQLKRTKACNCLRQSWRQYAAFLCRYSLTMSFLLNFFSCLKTSVRLWSLLIYISVITVYSQIPLFYRIQIIKTFRHWVIHFIQKISICFVRCDLIHNNFFQNCCGLIFKQFHQVNSWMQSCRCSSNDRDLRPNIRGWT